MSTLFPFKFKKSADMSFMALGRQTSILEWGLRLCLGSIFIVASWHKIVSPDQFATILYGYAVFPPQIINVLAIVMPFVELVCGVTLITGLLKRSGLLLINAMLAGFIFLISFNLIRGHEFDCGCFSVAAQGGSLPLFYTLIRDVLLLAAGLFVWKKTAAKGGEAA